MSLDPQTFLHMTVNQSNATKVELPEDGDYVAQIVDVTGREVTFKSGDRAGTKGIGLDVIWQIDDPAVHEKLGRNPKVRQSMLLDMTPEGSLDFGKGRNVSLGRLREAVDQNKDGQAWGFFMLKGSVATITVKQRLDENDPSKAYADVVGVKKL